MEEDPFLRTLPKVPVRTRTYRGPPQSNAMGSHPTFLARPPRTCLDSTVALTDTRTPHCALPGPFPTSPSGNGLIHGFWVCRAQCSCRSPVWVVLAVVFRCCLEVVWVLVNVSAGFMVQVRTCFYSYSVHYLCCITLTQQLAGLISANHIVPRTILGGSVTE